MKAILGTIFLTLLCMWAVLLAADFCWQFSNLIRGWWRARRKRALAARGETEIFP